jgi:hypothetical protein
VEATVKAIRETTEGVRLQVSFGEVSEFYRVQAPTLRSEVTTASDICRRAAFGDGCDQQAPVNIDKQQQEPQ